MTSPLPPDNTPPQSGDSPSPPSDAPSDDVLGRRRKLSWKSLGGEGFLVSVAFHGILAMLAIFYIVNRYKAPEKHPDAEVFSTGAGGEQHADRTKIADPEIQVRRVNPVRTPRRIVSKNAATLALPETASSPFPSFASGLTGGGFSSGSGGGSGGGSGIRTGIGAGVGKNFVGRFLGGKIAARRIAVYMDASGSMTPFLKRVEREAKTHFPQADVFRYNGIRVCVEDGRVVGGESYRGNFKKHAWPTDGAENNPADFGDIGKKLLGKADDAMRKSSVGGWFDRIVTEKYDAIIIFSDFRDGFVQYDKAGKMLMRQRREIMLDVRSGGAKAWENRWYRLLAKAKEGGAPRVYCYSIDEEPQPIWKKCAEVSGGGVNMVKWMRKKAGKPPEGEGLDEAADQVNRSKERDKPKPR